MRLFTLLFVVLTWAGGLMAQKPQPPAQIEPTGFSAEDFHPAVDLRRSTPARFSTPVPAQTLPALQRPVSTGYMQVVARDEDGRPIFVKGQLPRDLRSLSVEEQALYFLQMNAEALGVQNVEAEFVLQKRSSDELGMEHLRYRQYYQGVPLYASELVLHARDGEVFAMNGRSLPTPSGVNTQPEISPDEALSIAAHVAEVFSSLSPANIPEQLRREDEVELVLYAPHLYLPKGAALSQSKGGALSGAGHAQGQSKGDVIRLCWRVGLSPNAIERFELFIDAKTGELVHSAKSSCSFLPEGRLKKGQSAVHSNEFENSAPSSVFLPPGPVTANAVDLKGVTRTLHVYQLGGTYYMIDASRNMYDAGASNLPDDPAGVIWTLNAGNTNPQNGNFSVSHVTSGNNQWNDPTSVSAHYNAETSFEYFFNKFGRNSINGQGGNVISLINVSETDGSGMDNAFWSGTAMFYGNGNQAFVAPLCKALDVGGHEMSHGVIGSTANLIYEAQSGALNESFADVFGVMIDPANWQLGEDVVNTSIFPSGALRDMSNPHNGGSGPGDPSWQPAHMNEYQNLPVNAQNDNGGVHINSGIPNKAFYLFAGAVGNAKAEQVYYRALTQYLTASSQFVDCRLAVIQAAQDLYGSTEADAAASAFDQVGIGSGGGGTNLPGDLQTNPGADYILLTDLSDVGVYLYDGQSFPQLSTTEILSRPSVTDDGSAIVFVAADQTLRVLLLNQNTGLYEEYYVENNPQTIWRNIAVSKDGSKIAALTTDFDNTVFVYDYNTAQGQTFTLYTPTSGGTITYDVQYADVLEWDYSGEYIMYDAYNVLAGGIDYWDISFIRVWDKSSNSFGDGFINKLFNALPENSSVGNPAFSKNSPYIIALDFIDQSGFQNEYYLLGVNLETGEVGTILQNNTLGFPNYSIDDGGLIFDQLDVSSDLQISIVGLNGDKITASGAAQDFVYGGHWGVWYAIGDRPLVEVKEVLPEQNVLGLSPNPARDAVLISWSGLEPGQEAECLLYDLSGKEVLHTTLSFTAGSEALLSLPPLPKGRYELLLKAQQRTAAAQVEIQ